MPPKQKPGKSEQIVCTPNDFLAALTLRFGQIVFDLAANAENSIVPGQFFGPGSPIFHDALNIDWPLTGNSLDTGGWCFLNPPFGMIKGKNGFAAKAAKEVQRGCKILMLVPAAVGSNWFRDYVYNQSKVYLLNPRLTFVGHAHSYPKDLLLAVYSNLIPPDIKLWQWNETIHISKA